MEAHEQAFAFYGSLPEEIVYDQDHLLLTSENHGDLILTHEFAKYVEERAFRIHMCRKADPESKGKIENVVKYIKHNFARHRSFTNIDNRKHENICMFLCFKYLKMKMFSYSKNNQMTCFQERI